MLVSLGSSGGHFEQPSSSKIPFNTLNDGTTTSPQKSIATGSELGTGRTVRLERNMARPRVHACRFHLCC